MRRKLSIFLGISWAAWVGAGMFMFERYGLTPASAANAPKVWPTSGPTVDRAKSTLILFLHPKCPCSRATLSELAGVLERCSDKPNVRVLMMRPSGVEEGWERSGLWRSAEALPNAVIETDQAGSIAQKFGAVASGQVLLYTSDGQLAFNGGITPTRGQTGDNPGRRALLAALASKKIPSKSEPDSKVFGCELFSAGR